LKTSKEYEDPVSTPLTIKKKGAGL